MVGIIHGIRCHIGSQALCLRLVALLLQVGEDAERHVQHVLLRPYLLLVGSAVPYIFARFSHLQRNFILIVVVLIVTTQTQEHRQLIILQVGGVLLQGIGMGEHLDALVLDHHAQRLLVGLNQLWLARVFLSLNARRQHVVHRCLLGILLQTHGARLQGSACG